VPEFGPDSDILDSFDSLKDSEGRLGSWDLSLLQTDANREPLLARDKFKVTAAPTPKSLQENWPKGYKVPQFGVDRDVDATLGHIKSQEARLKHKYVPDSLKPKADIP
jgi:hypothetical protein